MLRALLLVIASFTMAAAVPADASARATSKKSASKSSSSRGSGKSTGKSGKQGKRGKTPKRSARPEAEQPPPAPTKIAWDEMDQPERELRQRTEVYKSAPDILQNESIDTLEGLANDVILSNLIKSVYNEATGDGWTQTQQFRILSLEAILDNSARDIPSEFNPHGMRVAVFALRLGKTQRGVILTSGYRADVIGQLRQLYTDDKITALVEESRPLFADLGRKLVAQLKSTDSKKSRYMSVTGSAEAWMLSCDERIGDQFCVNARIFDSVATDPAVFADALQGAAPKSELIDEIRKQQLAWPVDRAYISRGYKPCVCSTDHYGLDLTAPIGTPVRAVDDGVVRNAKNFSGWGRTVTVEHTLPSGGKYISLYGHLSKFRRELKPGFVVKRGDLIALSGNSGRSHGPHLHLEIRKFEDGKEPLERPRSRADQPLDPLRVLDIFNVFVGS